MEILNIFSVEGKLEGFFFFLEEKKNYGINWEKCLKFAKNLYFFLNFNGCRILHFLYFFAGSNFCLCGKEMGRN